MDKTSPDEVKSALGVQSFAPTSVNVTPSSDNNFSGRTAILFNYGYSTTGSCDAQKGADFLFVNGRLETYHVFSALDGGANSIPDPQKLARLKPGETNRSAVIDALGTPNYWSTGIALAKDQPEEIEYYWIAERSPLLVWKRLLIIFDKNAIVKGPPVIDRNLSGLSMGMWLCGFPPPVP